MVGRAVVVDSSIFIAFYHQADTQHDDAEKLLREFENDTLFVSPYVIQEVTTVLTYRFGVVVAKKFLYDISLAQNILLTPINIPEDIEHFLSLGKKISFTDASLINLARRMQAPLLTFDQQMIKLMKKKGR